MRTVANSPNREKSFLFCPYLTHFVPQGPDPSASFSHSSKRGLPFHGPSFVVTYLFPPPPSLPLGSCPPGKSVKKGTLLCPTRDSIIPKKPLTADRSPKRTVSYGVSFVTTNRPGPERFRVLQWPADVVQAPNLLSKSVDASSLRRRDGRTIVARASLEER